MSREKTMLNTPQLVPGDLAGELWGRCVGSDCSQVSVGGQGRVSTWFYRLEGGFQPHVRYNNVIPLQNKTKKSKSF